MTKETPLRRAVEKLGPLPDFLFSSMLISGAFAIVMCAVFGAVFVMFQAFGHGAANAVTLFAVGTKGAFFGVGIGLFFVVVALANAEPTDDPDERKERVQFFYGSLIGAVIVTIAAIGFWALFYDVLKDAGSVVYDGRT